MIQPYLSRCFAAPLPRRCPRASGFVDLNCIGKEKRTFSSLGRICMVRRATAREKWNRRKKVCANVFGYVVELELLAMMSCARAVLISRAVVVNLFGQQVFMHAVVTVLSSLAIPPQSLVGIWL